jgi:hypothetical protein
LYIPPQLHHTLLRELHILLDALPPSVWLSSNLKVL